MNRLRLLVVLMGLTSIAQSALAQLDENCTVSILNRNAQVAPDGSWIAPTIPANFGPVRARATCVEEGVTTSGESELFTIEPNGSVDVPPIQIGATTPIPNVLTLTAPVTRLGSPGATTRMTVVATYNDNSMLDVTGSNATSFTISNEAIATISPSGEVTAVSSGTVLVQASHEGASGLLSITVALSADSDGDGILDDIELREGLDPNNPTDALEDFDRDGLSNGDEVASGTLLRNPDTDGDTINDGEEFRPGVDGFVTNPLLPDTDGDGLRDALEVETGSDPTDATSFNLASALGSIEVTPPSFTLITNALQPESYTQLRVTGRLLDGYELDLTDTSRGTSYTSSDIQVCNFGSPAGRVYAAAEGACTITVANSGFSGVSSGSVRSFTPRALSQISIPGYANNVDVADGYAYVAAGSAGLQIVDVSSPETPSLAGRVDTNGNANDVRVLGRYAYVADGYAGVKVIDVVNPDLPLIVGSVDTPGEAVDLVVLGDLAYVADGYAGLTIVNVASPVSPIVVSRLDTPGIARGVDVSPDSLALVVDDGPSSVRVVDVSNPSQPQNRGAIAISGSGKDIRVNGSIAVVAAYTGGAQVIDFSDPAIPFVLGSVPGSAPNGFIPRDVELAGTFAVFAEQLFPNAIPFVSMSDPANPILRGIIDCSPLGDYAGTGIAIDGAYAYMTGEYFVVRQENGTSGDTRLFVGQYLPLEDLAGVAPEVTIVSPGTNEPQYEGTRLSVVATAIDDVAVASVAFTINGELQYSDGAAPYEYSLEIPQGISSMTIEVSAFDLAGNVGTASTSFAVIPDPLTTVSGIVVDESGAPVIGAAVSTMGGLTATTGAGGAFSIYGVPTVRGPIIAAATDVLPDGTPLSGSSSAVSPVPNGVTNVGTIVIVSATFESDYGTRWTSCDDCYANFSLPFEFPYFDTVQSDIWVGTNGYLTFGSGDWRYSETLPVFNNRPRIAGFFDDLYGRSQGAVWVNSSLPGRFVVTFDQVEHYRYRGSNTIQITLFEDGRILFGYQGITALDSGTIVGITPGPNRPFQQLDYSATPSAEVPAGTSIYEYFTSTNRFDMDGGFILYTRREDGSYNVRSVLANPTGATIAINGEPEGLEASISVSSGEVSERGGPFGKADVQVLSSGDPDWRGMTNTDSRGRFRIEGVPPGGISVIVTKKGKEIGRGGLVLRGNSGEKIKVKKARPEKKGPRSDS